MTIWYREDGTGGQYDGIYVRRAIAAFEGHEDNDPMTNMAYEVLKACAQEKANKRIVGWKGIFKRDGEDLVPSARRLAMWFFSTFYLAPDDKEPER